MIISLILISLLLALVYHILCGKPYVHEYLPGKYGIRSHNSYLDIDTFVRSRRVSVWKKTKSKEFMSRYLGHNLIKLKGICDGL